MLIVVSNMLDAEAFDNGSLLEWIHGCRFGVGDRG